MMQRKTLALLLATHLLIGGLGFAAGIYTLPILIAPPAPSSDAVAASQQQASFSGTFRRDLKDSDRLHWGEGKVSIGPDAVSLMGRLAPGPDYQLYLSPEFVETEADFSRLKAQMVHVGPVKTFDNFIVPLPASIDPARYTSVIVWCETFGQFITAARYR
ncbi:DM13 domain protein [Aeromonas salmonicida subsp. pectinolytica 34mel]|uniref:DM13 domain protein n=2 Tax=Aeromonas salmonicida TaxID=645 RepID=T0PHQ7_AERSA|nr:DM13 domain protein [Aeromonas salmonicida subsp. pectinolytica 34mel]EQC02226.1 phenylalanyl-tRNA synthetase subunit beta [Aeromonas salmonicida subsp. pectinolytica 34mel]